MSSSSGLAIEQSKQFATFFLDSIMFGIDVQKVQEIIRYQEMTPVPLAPEAVRGLINLRGQIITAIDLRQRLGLPAREQTVRPMNVVVHSSDGVVSLLVDRIGDVLELQSSDYENTPVTLDGTTLEMVSGVYKLKENLMLVLDADHAVQVVPAT